MTARTVWRLLRSGQLGALLRLRRVQRSNYRLGFLSAAVESGLLARLAQGAVRFDDIAREFVPHGAAQDGLRAWLQFGVRLGELDHGPQGYALRGWLARHLSAAAHDAVAALVEETASLHHALLTESPARLRAGRCFTLADQRGALIARSSRVLEPLIFEAIDLVIPTSGAVHLFDIGCGTGTYLRYAARRNAGLTAVGLDLQADVTELARRNLRAWQLADRIDIACGDVRARTPEPLFDVATLHNNIYYFPVAERAALLTHVRGFLRPGGRLLITTACQGGSVQTEILNLWAAMTEGCGPLPAARELEEQLVAAGYAEVRNRKLVWGDSYYAFLGTVPT